MFVHQKWTSFVALLKQSVKMSQQKFEAELKVENKKVSGPQLRNAWKMFAKHVEEFEVQQVQSQNKFVFSFMEGSLVKAVRNGDWILLDEINLATTETLECLSGLLQDVNGSLLLTEKGDVEPIQRHPNFRLFACMNPATDVGKRDLPPGLRNRFTEFYVHPPDNRYDDLLQIVKQYIYGIASGDERCYDDVAEFYMSAKKLANEHKLVDGANQRPHFSMRTLARALTYVVQISPTYGLRRSLYEGFCMTFLTQLDKESEKLMHDLIHKTILRNIQNPQQLVTRIPRQPAENFIQFGHFWLEQGQFAPEEDARYILTQSIEVKLYNLARVIMSRKFPVLIQGPTSAGKTSMVEYMAKKTGHRFVRINNHEHTDLQEYLGTYVSNNEGKLVFQEGVLVEALRNGYWIVLDELNLAPSDVLEALNRLLDDNRELLIPETQEVVKPHPHFMLFATQNPAGLYGGRKALSRAFRNRFLELHFDDIPEDELETILSKRCAIAPSYCKKLVKVYQDLMAHRQSTRIFEQKHGFITLRDLFRWAGRDPQGYQELAENGYMLLAERCRREEEKKVVKQVLEQVMKVKIDENAMYDCSHLEEFQKYDQVKKTDDNKLVWTKAMRRLFSLVARCLRYDEPVLLVGDTGCGKTTVCQMLAETYGRELHIVNCHQNTETGDLLGGQRPVRSQDEDMDKPKQLFEWHDGPLVQSMKDGHLFLLDEISLADDSVLERLNSVLEPSRLLVLAEKGGKHVEELYGAPEFKFLATMNPGGDYGKKELSPALRNRFTEIWVPSVTDRDDLINIIDEQMKHEVLKGYSAKMLDFIAWYSQALGQRTTISLRDILSWVKFMNIAVDFGLSADLGFAHGGCIVLLDGLGSHGSSSSFMTGHTLKDFRLKCLRHLSGKSHASEQDILGETRDQIHVGEDKLAIGHFEIPRGNLAHTTVKFTLAAPTTSDNAMRVVRAMQLRKPILLEGSPGVGKTSLVSALAAASGHHLVRINLSEQTDLMDLFGSDLPVEGGNSGEFAWRDAPFLQAMKRGDWVLLDELNLASQSVLEGLNSCLDHRGAVYIPELDREFFCHAEFRVFGAQNPLQQGGGRKGLPKSFVNRFTQVYVEQLTSEDLLFICSHLFSEFEPAVLAKMIEFNNQMYQETMVRCSFGRKGSPWEFNLRDVFRWLELMRQNNTVDPAEYLDIIYMQRMRTQEDRKRIVQLFEAVFGIKYERAEFPEYQVSTDTLEVGHSRLVRRQTENLTGDYENHILQSFLPSLQSLMKCVESSWMAILTGPVASGKTSLVRLLSKMTGNTLQEFAMNSSVDTMELLGGFEQVDLNRHRSVLMDMLKTVTNAASKSLLMYSATLSTDSEHYNTALQLVRQLNDVWFVLESKQTLNSSDLESVALDYVLVTNMIAYLKSAATIDVSLQEYIVDISQAIENLQKLEKDTIAGKFEWIDGLLINALEKGHWLLIDNANLCNPSVLDRLNPLFENDGVLMVNERGLVDGTVKVIKPHPNFRMFMTVDPQNGELSRAMRNRGIEIALLDSDWNKNEQDATKIVNSLGVRGADLPLRLHSIQKEASDSRGYFGKSENVRDYLMFATYMSERLQRGQSLKEAIRDSFFQVFVDIEQAPQSLVDLLEDESSLEQWLSPTNAPFLISGKMYEQDSNLATVSLHGAYLIYLTQTLDTEDKESLRKIEVAGDYFLECLNQQNYGLSYRWLGYMSQQSTGLERLGYLMREIHAHSLFIELSQTRGEALVHLRMAYKLLIRTLKQEYANNAMRLATQKLKLGNLTALQQSFCFSEGRLSESQLLHPVVSKLYVFFESVQAAVSSWIAQCCYRNCSTSAFDVFHRLLDIRDFAWTLTQMENLSLDKFLISIRIMAEMISQNGISTVEFDAITRGVQEIMSGFDFETSESMKALWSYFHPNTLSSEALHLLETELHKANTRLNCYKFGSEQGLTPKSLVLHAKTEAKESLIEGLATLYAVDMNDAENLKQMLKSLRNLPEYIHRELETEIAVTVRRETLWDTAMMPLYDYSSVVDEMELLAQLHVLSSYGLEQAEIESLVDCLLRFKKFALEKSSRPPLDVLPYQRFVWHLDSGSANDHLVPGMLQDAAYVHHQRLWRSSVSQKDLYGLIPNVEPKDVQITEGSLALHQSAETFICLNILGSVEKMPADAYDSALKQLKDLQKYLSSNEQLKDRRYLEVAILISTARQLLNASASVLGQEVYASLSAMFDKTSEFVKLLLKSTLYTQYDLYFDQVVETLASASQLAKQSGLSKYYVTALESIQQSVEHLKTTERKLYSACGKARVLLGLAFVSAYVPDYPVDPTSEPRLRVDLLLEQKQAHLNTIHVREKIEKIYTGNSTNATLNEERSSLQAVNETLSKNATVFSLRPHKSQLDDIFVDLRYLQKNMLEQNVENLLIELEVNGTDNVLQREALLQGNALQFVDRVYEKFPLYRDILQPLIVAVDDIKYGLRMLTAHCRTNPTDEFLSKFIELLIREPDSVQATGLDWYSLATPEKIALVKSIVFERATTSRKWAFYLRILITILQRIVMAINTSGHLQAQDMVTANNLFNEIIQVWKSAEEYKQKMEAEKDALYKTRARKYEPPTDEELEEQDLKTIFADFNDEFADLNLADDEMPKNHSSPTKVEESSVLDDEDINRIGHLHRLMFEMYQANVCKRRNQSFDREAIQSYATANELAAMAQSPFMDLTDRICNAGHLRIAALAIRRLESENSFATTSDSIYDFYKSENVHEVKKVEPIVNRFKARVLELIEQWPEHAILEHLVVICDRILTFSILSPVAKFLTGVELLLQKSEDWEAYAAKHVSLQSQRDELVALIVQWRQLELNCWPKLLAAQEAYHQDAAFKWWFHLYDTVNNTFFDSDEEYKSQAHALLGALDQFIQTSSIIEFEPRLKMIDTFYHQALLQAQFSNHGAEKLSFGRTAVILRNVYLYYSQFKDHVELMMGQMRKPIEKDLKDFVKIATWKDVNIHALQQSAGKTHKKLHKCICKYREVLNTTMLTVIANYNQEQAMYQYGDEKKYADINHGLADQLSEAKIWTGSSEISVGNFDWTHSPVKPHLANLPATLNRLRAYCKKDIFVSKQDFALEGLMTEMISQVKHFQKQTPSTLTEENKSMVMNQKLLKKKALVDFLKELRRLGLKSRSSNMRESNSDTTSLFINIAAKLETMENANLQRLYSHATADISQQWHKANDYYYRCIARLTHLRTESTINVSKDLSMLEVERSMTAAEHMFHLVRKERHIFAQMEERIEVLQGASVQLSTLYEAFGRGQLATAQVCDRLANHKVFVDKLALLLKQALTVISLQASGQPLKELEVMCASVQKVQRTVDYYFVQRELYPKSSTGLDFALMSKDVEELLEDNAQKIDLAHTTLVNTMESLPQSSHVLFPIIQYVNSFKTISAAALTLESDATLGQLRDKVHSLIDVTLVSIQDLRKVNQAKTEKEETEEEKEEMAQNYLVLESEKQFSLVAALHMESATQRCLELLTLAHQLLNQGQESHQEISQLLQETYPFLQQYMLIVQHTLARMLMHHKSMAKFTYCLVNSFNIIITKGFCMPAGLEGEEGDADGKQSGTGIGEGEGAKDVSHEIEDEEQVLGTQNEERSDEKQDTKEEKNGMDMDNDFEGNLEDMEQDQDEEDESDSSDDEDNEPDEQIGEVDDMDPDAVDDKMWGEEGEDNLNESDKTVEDQGQQQDKQEESDIVAKEEEEGAQDDKKENKPDKNQQKDAADNDENGDNKEEGEQDEDEGQEGDEKDEGEEGAEEDEDDVQNRPGEQLDTEIPEAETLELPEDMNMEGDDGEEKEGGENEETGMDDPMDMDETPAEEQNEEGEAFHDVLDELNEGEQEDEEMADASAQMDTEQNEQEGDQENGEEESEEKGEEEGKEEVADATGDQEDSKNGAQIEQDEDEDMESTAQNREQPNSDATADNQFGVQGQSGKQSKSSAGKKEGEDDTADMAEGEDEAEKKENRGKSSSGSNEANNEDNEDSTEGAEDEPKREEANPQRSLGDALEKWRRRLANLDDELNNEEEESEKTEDKDTEDAQVKEDDAFEYVKNDEDSHDMQAMGNAQVDQVQDLKTAAMDEDQQDENQVSGEMNVDQPEDIETMPLPRDTLDMSGSTDQQGAILSKKLPENQLLDETQVLTMDESVVSREPLEQQDIELMREELETRVSDWREEGRDINKARELWQGYENLTHDLAMGLCEQLRLILEPTLATKLKGDYRTGKRLNMKKIIPYIASQFKKDKIWLRRTKMSKRQYQIMISVDDSKSMSESRSVQLAYETLALISKALTQLEVGDISISSFGERVRLLHPFGQPFTAESGASVLQQFTFAQQKTYVKNLIETSLGLFENAKHTSGPGKDDLWQLQLVISDGICEDHDKLRSLVRSALEQRIMIIFIVVDNKPEKDSILSMTNITYTIDDGKYGIQMKPYLETFPFQYFMIVRDVASLPEALSDALRQYFSFVAS
ncbi:unnamed protein product [Rhizopus stolonifer]